MGNFIAQLNYQKTAEMGSLDCDSLVNYSSLESELCTDIQEKLSKPFF